MDGSFVDPSASLLMHSAVLLDKRVQQYVQWHAAIEEERWTCVAVWEVVPEAGNDSYLKCTVLDDDVRLLPTSRLLESAIHSSANVGEISTVLIPLSLVLGEPPRASGGEPSGTSRG